MNIILNLILNYWKEEKRIESKKEDNNQTTKHYLIYLTVTSTALTLHALGASA